MRKEDEDILCQVKRGNKRMSKETRRRLKMGLKTPSSSRLLPQVSWYTGEKHLWWKGKLDTLKFVNYRTSKEHDMTDNR